MVREKKRGLSPVVATALLIAIVVVLALIIFLWARGFISEKNLKFDRAIEFACNDVDFVADYVAVSDLPECNGMGEVGIVNQGDVPIYGMIIKEVGPGIVNINEPFGKTILKGESQQICLNEVSSSTQALLVVPILLGESGTQRKTYECEDAFGYPITIASAS